MSRMPVRLISKVRGTGVAVSVSTSTSALIDLMASLCRTPKRCSSSMTSSPRRLKRTSDESIRWVPTTTSTSPVPSPRTTSRAWPPVRNRLRVSTRTGRGP